MEMHASPWELLFFDAGIQKGLWELFLISMPGQSLSKPSAEIVFSPFTHMSHIHDILMAEIHAARCYVCLICSCHG